MLQFARWKSVLVVAVVLFGLIATIPNFFSEDQVRSWPDWLPNKQLVLGLDLQGGVYLLYQVDKEDYIDKRLKSLSGSIRSTLRPDDGDRIGYTGLRVRDDGVDVTLTDASQADLARTRLRELENPLLTGLLSVAGGSTVNEFELQELPGNTFRLEFTEEGLEERIRSIVSQSIEVIRKRIDELGTTEPSIQREGVDRILVEVPGLDDPERLKALVGQTAQMTFHMVNTSMTGEQALESRPPPGTIVVNSAEEFGPPSYLLNEAAILSGEDLVDAQATFDQQNNQPVVSFRFNTAGGIIFATTTEQNVGRPFAIVLDNEVISAPVIREPIRGGSGIISGDFSVEDANDLAILLRAGSLPARLIINEERTVGPGLGQDSIEAGEVATLVAAVAVVAFMLLTYGLFGVFSNLALIANIFLIMGMLSILGATLTLPGIAGIVLTVGMAVDANVLIYERIREESRQGRSVLNAIDAGYRRALGTILDANITTLIAAIILFTMGSGPIKGFAVTLAIGIGTTVFTAFVFSRFLIALWVQARRPKALPI